MIIATTAGGRDCESYLKRPARGKLTRSGHFPKRELTYKLTRGSRVLDSRANQYHHLIARMNLKIPG